MHLGSCTGECLRWPSLSVLDSESIPDPLDVGLVHSGDKSRVSEDLVLLDGVSASRVNSEGLAVFLGTLGGPLLGLDTLSFAKIVD